MASMEDYRTPAELAEQANRDGRIRSALDQAIVDYATAVAVIGRGDDQVIVDLAVDQLYDRLRALLDSEDRVRAIVYLLDDRHRARGGAE